MTKLEQACQLLGDRVTPYQNGHMYKHGNQVVLDGNLAFALFDVVATWPKDRQTDFCKAICQSVGFLWSEEMQASLAYWNVLELTPDHVIDAAWESKP